MLGRLFPLSSELCVAQINGFVEMGTTSPSESLQIGEYFQTERDDYIEMRTSTGPGTAYRAGIKLRAVNPFYGFDIEHDDILNGLKFRRYDLDAGVTGESTLYLDRVSGDVGFRTTFPTQNLHVLSVNSAVLRLEADINNQNEFGNPRVEFSQDGGLEGGIVGFRSGSNDLELRATGVTGSLLLGDGDMEHIRVLPNGLVGIGTTLPQGGPQCDEGRLQLRARSRRSHGAGRIGGLGCNGTRRDPIGKPAYRLHHGRGR